MAQPSIATDIKQYIDERDAMVEERVKGWLIRAVLAQLVTMLPVIFFLGGIYAQNAAALDLLKAQQSELAQSGRWMDERERWEQAVEQQWPGGVFQPPRYRSAPAPASTGAHP